MAKKAAASSAKAAEDAEELELRRVPEWLVWPSCRHNWTFEGTRTAPGALSCVCCEKRESQEQADESLDLSAGASRDENSVDRR